MFAASAVILLMLRAGVQVPIVSKAATPLLAERERTYQLESVLAWLHISSYCDGEISFVDNAGNPVESIESAMSRWNRPPAGLNDVQLFWRIVLQCPKSERPLNKGRTVTVTFGSVPELAGQSSVFEVKGKYAGTAAAWIANSDK